MKAKVLKTVYDIGVQVGRKTYSIGYRIQVKTRADELFRKYRDGKIRHDRFNDLMAKRGAKVVLLSRCETEWSVVTNSDPKNGDTLERLADEASELVESMGLNPPYARDERFEETDIVEEITDNDCDRPCVGDVERALNLVVRLAALHRNGGAK